MGGGGGGGPCAGPIYRRFVNQGKQELPKHKISDCS